MTKIMRRTLIQSGGIFTVVVAAALTGDDSQPKADDAVAAKPVYAGSWQHRPLVKEWKVEDLADDAKDLSGRSVRRGRAVYIAAGCIQCHQVNEEGGKFGAKITDLTKRFTGRRLLQHILEPSLDIAKGYETHIVVTRDGRVVAGFVVKDTDDAIHLLANPNHPEEIEIVQKSKIEERHKSAVSTMPEGALYSFSREEILDLLAFVQSGAKASD